MKKLLIAIMLTFSFSSWATTALELSYSDKSGTIQKVLFYAMESDFNKANVDSIEYDQSNNEYILKGEVEYPLVRCRKKFIRGMNIPSYL